MHVNIIVRTKELARNVNDPNLLIVDTRTFKEYSQGHIPGAINIDLFQFHWLDTSRQGINEFERQTRILLSNIGVKKNQIVVFYDDISGMSAARGVWILLYFSHQNVTLLDGGFTRWREEGYPLETKTNSFTHSHFEGKQNPKILARYTEVKESIRKKDSFIVDARTKDEYSGTHIRAARAGHIPSAINVDWEQNIEEGSFKSPEQLRKLYSNIPKNSKIITYCQGGYRAANSFLALKILGYIDVKLYLGSWGEWGNKDNLPVEI
jgi:thiosulfate/3-mercaptopyruvate sulfurtransferase